MSGGLFLQKIELTCLESNFDCMCESRSLDFDHCVFQPPQFDHIMKPHSTFLPVLLVALACAWIVPSLSADDYLARDGRPLARIITPDEPPSSVRLAASELQEYLQKITGAELPVLTETEAGAEPDAELPVAIYLGATRFAAGLGIDPEVYKWGAYHMQSGDGWLVLTGNDTVFEPRGIYALNRGRWTNEGEAAWDEATGAFWRNPIGGRMFRHYDRDLDLWSHDEKGTLNAVYGFLKHLGVRWYMPGELGEVVPEEATLPLPELNVTVEPDYTIRLVNYDDFGMGGEERRDTLFWALRQGVNHPFGYRTHHGIANVTRREEQRERYPEFYAVYNNERDVESGTPAACLSSEALFEENLRYVRFLFDMYDVPVVDVMPDDGFSSICQCELCKGKDTPERGRQGLLSDYVWDYVNRMALEVAKSHPDKFITCGAYSTYWLPPEQIDQLSDNIIVYIVNGRRRFEGEEWENELRRETAREWQEKTGNPVMIFMNPGGGANTPRLFAEDIQDLKGIANGEDMWAPWGQYSLANSPGFNHLNYFITEEYHWDADQDIDELLGEYYDKFYGPAGDEMAAFIDFYEVNQRDMRKIDGAPVVEEALGLFEAAKDQVDPDSVYGQRLAVFEHGMTPLMAHYERIKAGRVDVPTYVASRDTEQMSEIVIDGKLEEEFWSELNGSLTQLQTGEDVEHATHFKIGVDGYDLYIGILCRDVPGEPLNAVELERDDFALWAGDVVDVLIETPEHSYYQIAANPKGSIANIDRAAGLVHGARWDAQAEIAVHVDEEAGYWSLEARIPFTPSTQDPLHQVVGPPPSAENPWHFNVCRLRIRDQGEEVEMSAFSPTGERGFHQVLKFGVLE